MIGAGFVLMIVKYAAKEKELRQKTNHKHKPKSNRNQQGATRSRMGARCCDLHFNKPNCRNPVRFKKQIRTVRDCKHLQFILPGSGFWL
jgi:hypothetical protein